MHEPFLGKMRMRMMKKTIQYIERQQRSQNIGTQEEEIRVDLASSSNDIAEWDKKVAMKSSSKIIKKAHRIRLNANNIESSINRLHRSSHFAPTGKNPESSRGHICYVTTVHLKSNNCSDLIAHWMVVDLAGSEGESAINTVEASEVMARRLEAWCINHGLSQLQVIFNELRGIKKKGASIRLAQDCRRY
eukprot:177720_1